MRISLCRLAKLAQTASRMDVKESVSTKTKPVLYGYAKSSCSWRVRAALFHKNIDYDLQPYDPLSPQADKEAYMKLNGLGQVPTLIIDGRLLTQSIAILEYLEETHRENPLLPKDSIQRARVRQIVELINSGIQPLQNPTVAKRVSEDPEKQKEWQVRKSMYRWKLGRIVFQVADVIGKSGWWVAPLGMSYLVEWSSGARF